MHDRDLRSETLEDVAEFGRDEPAAQDDQVFGQRVDPHDRVGGVERRAFESVDVRHLRPCARSQHDAVGADLGDRAVLQSDRHGAIADESGVALEDGDVVLALAVLDPIRSNGVDPVEDPVTDRWPVRAVRGDVHVHHRSGLGRLDHPVRRQHQHLRWDASGVQAGAAEGATFDDRDVPVLELGAEDRVARSGSDDEQVEVSHDCEGTRDRCECCS